MAKDPAFLFYPGDYLRDTQTLSEKVQVAYDRILCEHMRNICITHDQLKFFTKKLNEDELTELKMVLTETTIGFQIEWVADSISKRKAYSNSRRENRSKKTSKDMNNISESYDKHMVIENEIVIEGVIKNKKVNPKKNEILESGIWIQNIAMQKKIPELEVVRLLETFLADLILKEDFGKPVTEIKKHFISWLNIQLKNGKNKQNFTPQPGGFGAL